MSETHLVGLKQNLLHSFAVRSLLSPTAERQTIPEVELLESPDRNSRLPDISHERVSQGTCLIERTVNSCRINLSIKKADELETLICAYISTFFSHRAESFEVLRRVPVRVGLIILLLLILYSPMILVFSSPTNMLRRWMQNHLLIFSKRFFKTYPKK